VDIVEFPSDKQISRRAFELFFKERAAPRTYDEYRRQAEDELLERAFQKLTRSAHDDRRFRRDR